MDKDLKALLAELVEGEDPTQTPVSVLPAPEVIESDSEEAWNDFQNSQFAYDQAFHKSKLGSL
jgi:hypothetical protein